MILFWVLVGVGAAWFIGGLLLALRLEGWTSRFVFSAMIIGLTIIMVAVIGSWDRVHPDPAYGSCEHVELRPAPTLVDGKIMLKPEWVCTLWS